MKKYLVGLFSLALAICFNVLQSNTPIPKESGPADLTTYDWYPVIDDEIVSTIPSHINKTKAQAISDDPCKNQTLVNCLFGTNDEVEEEQDVSEASIDQLIKTQN
jgi:hypothetical protein